MIENLQDWAQSFPGWLQWVAIFLIAAIPLIESYTGTFIGIAIGLHPVIAASAAIAGNTTVVVLIVFLTDRIRTRVRGTIQSAVPPRNSRRRERLRTLFERVGIPGVSLLGHPTQVSAAAMVGFGADRSKVILWEVVSIVVWGAVIAVVAGFGIELLLH